MDCLTFSVLGTVCYLFDFSFFKLVMVVISCFDVGGTVFVLNLMYAIEFECHPILAVILWAHLL